MKKIVCLDDTKTVLVALNSYLKNYELCTFNDVDEFINDVRINTYDLFIIDINLPKRNGLDIINEIKNYPHLIDKFFIILSAEPSTEYKIIAKKLGVRAYIKKPFSNKLAVIIERIFRMG